jgi:hypothetical protein
MIQPKNIITIFSMLVLLTACGNSEKQDVLAKKINLTEWKADKGGCSNVRIKMLEELKSSKEILRGMNINEITTSMGKPDMQVLANRNQKFYVYCLENGKHCQDIRQGTDALTMGLRFSALGMLTEVTFQHGKP